MQFVSWNVNGLRAAVGKGFQDFFRAVDADCFCIQETKLQEGQITLDMPGYGQYWNFAAKKGYSGTAIFCKHEPLSASYGIGQEVHDQEGRVITLEWANFYLVNVYTPNSRRDLERLPYRMEWEDAFRSYLLALDKRKPAIVCGDMNVAHQEIDLKNCKSNVGNSGFTYEEREKMSELLSQGFVDSFRHIYPDREGAYTWWSYMGQARSRNIGWRIDYFLVSDRIQDGIREATIYSQIPGSDHCPIGLEMDL